MGFFRGKETCYEEQESRNDASSGLAISRQLIILVYVSFHRVSYSSLSAFFYTSKAGHTAVIIDFSLRYIEATGDTVLLTEFAAVTLRQIYTNLVERKS
jgi:hypothetical protein